MISCCTFSMLNYFRVAFFYCCTFIVVLFPHCTLSVSDYFYFSLFLSLFMFYSCCTFLVLLFLHVALFSYCTFLVLDSFYDSLFSYCTLFSCYTLFMLFFFCVALFSCCSFPCFTIFILRFLYCTLFMLHCYAWIFFRTGFLDKTSEWLSLFHMLCKSCNLEILLNNFLPNISSCQFFSNTQVCLLNKVLRVPKCLIVWVPNSVWSAQVYECPSAVRVSKCLKWSRARVPWVPK